MKWLVEGEGDCQPDPSIHIIDLLGVYQNRNNKVILYDLLIKLCSLKLEIDYEGPWTIAMLHELSHAVTHRGLDSNDRIWEFFDIADRGQRNILPRYILTSFCRTTTNRVWKS